MNQTWTRHEPDMNPAPAMLWRQTATVDSAERQSFWCEACAEPTQAPLLCTASKMYPRLEKWTENLTVTYGLFSRSYVNKAVIQAVWEWELGPFANCLARGGPSIIDSGTPPLYKRPGISGCFRTPWWCVNPRPDTVFRQLRSSDRGWGVGATPPWRFQTKRRRASRKRPADCSRRALAIVGIIFGPRSIFDPVMAAAWNLHQRAPRSIMYKMMCFDASRLNI